MNRSPRIDTPKLLWTLACISAAVIPHLIHLPPWPLGLMLVTLIWRLAAHRGQLPLPGALLRLLLAVIGFSGVFFSYGTITGLDAGSTLLVVMAALKLTETRTVRDLIVLLLVSYFLIVTQFLFGQSILIGLYSVPVIWLITTALSQVSSPAAAMPWRRAFSQSGLLLAHAVPLMLIAFVLFPRLSGPFWAIPRSENTATTGLSDEMSPGSITRLLQSDAVAFRASFDDTVPPPEQRYWRGPVLSKFDGRTWSVFQKRDREITPVSIDLIGEATGYEITLEPHQSDWLFSLEQANPAGLPPRSYMTSDRRVMRIKPVTQLYQYRLESWVQHRANANIDTGHWTLERDRQFPENHNKRAQELAQSWRADADDTAAVIGRALSMFREQEFIYTLTPPRLDPTDPVDDFLFSTRRGFCEHYASAFTLMMRAAGIPARVVLGYQGGELNPFAQHMTVRQSDAHAWSEVWLAGRGWVRVDPTAAVAPDRVQLGVADALPEGESLPGLFRAYAWIRQLQFGWDALNNGWNQWVLGFSREEQLTLLRALGMKRPGLRKMLLTMIGLITLVLGAVAVHLIWQSRPVARDPLARTYQRFCRKVARIAGQRADHEGPLDFANRIAASQPALAGPVSEITRLYLNLRYFPATDPGNLAQFKRAVRALRV
ncbi:MAG: DUF3488 and transglutaminase-like domain-containing protein [Gammaproteobacteria bacterium]|nr:DUF3488 and transglutaminase-like domain-containing protein [Gammaproteobacteria bacterium]